MNFKANFLRMVFFYSEYLYASMVEPAHESPARWLVYYTYLEAAHVILSYDKLWHQYLTSVLHMYTFFALRKTYTSV